MVEANEDALAVTMKIRRETRVAKERAVAERFASQTGELQLPPPVPGTGSMPLAQTAAAAHVAVPAQPVPAGPVDADAAFRRARLGIVAVIALALLLVWIVQRRARPPRGVV